MKKLAVVLLLLISAATGIGAWNYFSVHQPAAAALAADKRNEGVRFWVYYRYGVTPDVLVLDIRAFENKAPIDALRGLFQIAEAHKNRKFDRVVLSFRGKEKLQLKGDYFQKLGTEFPTQNPVYLMRTLPSNVFKLDGTPAYGTWEGGILGVLAKQMEDLHSFSNDWYAQELRSIGASTR